MVEALLTDGDLAKLLRLSPVTIRQRRADARKRGEIPDLPPTLRIGRNVRFRQSDVVAWLSGKVDGRELQVVG